MRVLTWLPRDFREQLAILDPARNGDPGPTPPVDPLIRSVGGVETAALDPEREIAVGKSLARRRWIAPLGVAARVAAVAVGVVVGTSPGGSHRTTSPNATPTSAATNPGGASTAGAARRWASFPATASPRPVVLLGEAVVGPRAFVDGDSKIAFGEGRVRLATSLPDTPRTRDGYRLIDAADAVRQLASPQKGPATFAVLQITSIDLADQLFETDRGQRSLPAWRMHLTGATGDVFVFAIARPARYPHTGNGSGGQPALVSADGLRITFRYVARHVATDPCDLGYTSTLNVEETRSAVVLAISTRSDAPSTLPTNVACANPLTVPLRPPLKPGAPDTRTITLHQPLGGRVVVDARGNPYQITSG
jgi:hypothetical protein